MEVWKDIEGYKGIYQVSNLRENKKFLLKKAYLEWVTRSQNIKHAYITGLNKITELKRKKCSINGKKAGISNQIKINQYDLNGNKIKTWNSAREVMKVTGFNESCIRACCRGKRKKAYNYIWKNAI